MTDNPVQAEKSLKGIAVSPGIIIGKAHLVDRSRVKILYQYLINDDHINKEVERFREAIDNTERQLITLKDRMPEQVQEHAFFKADFKNFLAVKFSYTTVSGK